jgi:hypothetical protein
MSYLNVFKYKFLVLYGHESLSLTQKKEQGLKVFEAWVLRKIFGPKGYEAIA